MSSPVIIESLSAVTLAVRGAAGCVTQASINDRGVTQPAEAPGLLPAGRDRPALGVARGALQADHRAVGELRQRRGAGVGAG